jgi:hypothetical protein
LPERERRELDAIQYVIDQIDAMKVVPPDESYRRRGCYALGRPYLLGLIKEVITKTISQQEQIGRSPIYKRVVSA